MTLSRRRLLTTGGALAATTTLGASLGTAAAQPGRAPQQKNSGAPLSFGRDGKFRIVQFNDTQDGHLTDRRTIEFIGRTLDEEQPDFALINGDVINGSPQTAQQVYQAINNVVLPMESRSIPWALTFGNHDEDSLDNGTGVTEEKLVEFIRQYRFNRNAADGELTGSANTHLPVRASTGDDARFAIWLLDSGRYAPAAELAGQSTDGNMGYDWIRPDQVRWYLDTSVEQERRHGRKVPGLMFFHIPTFEHHHMWFGRQFASDEATHAEAVARHGIVGEKNEGIYTGLFNSGIYAAAFERGDVLGMYCGHDHINTFMGNYYGIELGYGPGTGFGTYGLNDGTWDQHTLRGARVFDLDEGAEQIYTGTRLVFARDYGVDMNPAAQPIDAPEPVPAYVTLPA
ncbi:metallophosphoesterase family protein [Corynebacterium guangdongense]|uniref:Calcineurin-like phosphoesterase domain-containing protein n=1 Tax=Corynebacterium guangdongense TaxID=1783348 RepID=A0ABU1ZY23_9CORY|nr:metallophosphoesterase family protein [Corynebacterium guangdongense]MDR7329127.1 hypothetical protein [Corynebacterium guangdongense]WJZ17696.1 Calcineurin-like phosphoesterase [Corynebacterium guangdongense]